MRTYYQGNTHQTNYTWAGSFPLQKITDPRKLIVQSAMSEFIYVHSALLASSMWPPGEKAMGTRLAYYKPCDYMVTEFLN